MFGPVLLPGSAYVYTDGVNTRLTWNLKKTKHERSQFILLFATPVYYLLNL